MWFQQKLPLFLSVSALALGLSEVRAQTQGTDSTPADTIVVTASRLAEVARKEQKASINLVNIQSAEDLIKYPDFNAAEALARIPGVSLSSDTGEGRFVNIRGLDANLNGATFGGVVLLNTQPGGTVFGSGRAVEFDTIPIGVIDRLIVRKTGRPDQEAEGLGGSVEISPRTAAGIKRDLFVEARLGGSYEELRDRADNFDGEVTVGGRFGGGDKPFSFVLTGSYHTDRRGFDDIEAAYATDNGDAQPTTPAKAFDTLELRRYNYHRRRFGIGGELEYNPEGTSHYFIRATYAGYVESVNRHRLIYSNLNGDADGNTLGNDLRDPANPNAFIAPNTALQVTLRDEQETHKNLSIAAGGRNDIGIFNIDYIVSYTSAGYNRLRDFNSTFNSSNNVVLRYDNITDANFPRINILNGVNPNDPTQFTLGGRFSNTLESAEDSEWAAALNITVPIHLVSEADKVKFGGKVRLRKKVDTPTNFSFPAPTLALTQVQGPGPFPFYNGQYTVGFVPDYRAIRAFFAANPTLFVQRTQADSVRNAGGTFNDRENIYAGYVQYEGKLGPVDVLAGVRIENTDANYRGIVAATPDGGDTFVFLPNSNPRSYTDVFPTVQAKYEVTPELVARGTWSTGIGRPGFFQLQSGANVDVGAGTATTGNPNLRPTTVNAFDASLEYYLPNAGILSVGFFDKEFDNYIVSRRRSNVSFPGVTGIFIASSFDNANSGRAYGFEGNYDQKFTFLPGWYGGFGVFANATLVDTRVELRPGEFGALPAASNLTFNAGAYYEKYGAKIRLSTSYVGESLFAIGGSASTDVYQDKRFSVDLTSSYDLTHNASVYFNAKNLTNTPLRYYEGSTDRPIQREFYDITYEFGVRLNF